MAKAVNLETEVMKILDKYAGDVVDNLDAITKDLGSKGAKKLQQNSQIFKGSGKYAEGWTVELKKSRFGAAAIIHNKLPGLPHLLEHGHANRWGGRTEGKTHIAPVEEELVELFQKEVMSKL